MATARLLGASIKRREDPRFITGKGNYTDDLKLTGMTHAAFVRSPHANAKIRNIDTSKASKAPGVIAESQSAASDAADLVAVDWEVLPSVTATEQATAKGSVQIHEVAPDNVAF